MKFQEFLILMIVCIKYAEPTLFACPPASLCVSPKNCKPENVTFNALVDKDKEYKYVCGILAQCEGNVCCNDTVDLPINLQPNMTNWCYLQNNAVPESTHFPVIPYPGLEDSKPEETSHHIPSLCPTGSVCVPGSLCSLEYITFAFGVSSDEFTCGNHTGSGGNICCTISGIFEVPHLDPELKPQFMKVSKRETRGRVPRQTGWSFLNSDYYANNIVVLEKGELFTGISGKSLNTQNWFCGRTLSIAGELNRIYAPVGEREAKEGDYPWHVAILSSKYEYLCSGAIIAERVVVSIAHCFDKHKTPADILVRVGDLNLKLESEKNPAYDVKVKHLILHPNYHRINLDADIAIIEMEESVKSLPNVRAACLPQRGFSPLINQCKVPGWGQFSKSKEETNEFNYALRAASFYIIDNSQCQNSLRKVKELGVFFKLQKGVLCAKGYSNADTCKGDGGSGLVCRDKDVYVLKGLVSYGFGCGLDLPGVYTDVEKYLDFIRNYKKFIPISSNNVYYEPISSDTKFESTDFDSYSQTIRPDSGKEGYIVSGSRKPENIPQYILDFEDGDSYRQDEEKVYEDVYDPVKTNYVNKQIETDFIFGNQDSEYDLKVEYIKPEYDSKVEYIKPEYDSKVEYIKPEYDSKVEYIKPEYDSKVEYIKPEYDSKVEYIKPEEPSYVKKSDYNPNLYVPDNGKEIYSQGSVNNRNPVFEYERTQFAHDRDEYGEPSEKYDYISKPEPDYIPTDLYNSNDRYFEGFEPSLNGYSDDSNIREYGSIYEYESNPNYDEDFYDPTSSDSRYDEFYDNIFSNSRYDEPTSYSDIYEEPHLDYKPTYEVENGYNNFDEIYLGTTSDGAYGGTSKDPFDNRLYYDDYDHLKFRRGLRKSSNIAPKNVNVKAYTKKISGKAPEQFANILNAFPSYATPVREGKVLSPLAMLRKNLNDE